MPKTKIIATIGPSCQDAKTLREMILNGLNVARFNFSHTSWPKAQEVIDTIKKLRDELNMPVAIMIDLQGPKIRLGKVEGTILLKKGSYFTLKNKDMMGNEEMASISYPNLYQDVKKDTIILINDGTIKLKVVEINQEDIKCLVLNEGYISSFKSLNVPDVNLNIPFLSSKDLIDLQGAIKNDIDYVALSFVQRKEDIEEIRKIIKNENANLKVIAKIESKEALRNFKSILKLSDGIMVARGDLGVEIPFTKVPIFQKRIIEACLKRGKVVITATQMLESMINNLRPTRAEVSDVANAIYDGTSAIMLSEETSLGKYPVNCLKTMKEIALETEKTLDYTLRNPSNKNYEFIINRALLAIVEPLNVQAVFAFSKTGDTPRILASFRAKCPIYVSTKEEKNYHQLALVWNVYPHLVKEDLSPKEIILNDIKDRARHNLLKKDDIILIAGGKYIPNDSQEFNKNVGGIYKI